MRKKVSWKILLPLAFVGLLAAGCGKSKPQVGSQPTNPTATNQQAANVGQAPKPTPQDHPADNSHVLPAGVITVSQIVDGSTIRQPTYQAKTGENAFDLLNTTHKIKAKDYGSGMGQFVQTIDGVTPDSKHFWAFYLNGKSSNLGASNYQLQNGDFIEWKLETISNTSE